MILENPIFVEMILPFMLVFVTVFAILQRSKILGDGKEQIDAIVALVIGLLLIGVPAARDIVVGIMPWLAVGVSVILVFLILYGFVAGDLSGENMPGNMKNVFLALASVFTIVVVLYISGLWKIISTWFSSNGSSDIWMSVFMIAIILVVMAVAVKGGKRGNGKDD